jgi:hypothetical protein
MKQLLICYKQERKLLVRASILTDVAVPVEDIISPQKTTLVVPKNDAIQVSDFVIIKDNNSGAVEYIGYIDTLSNKVNTEISCFPLINVFDNDFLLDQMFQTVKKGSYTPQGVWVESETETEDVDIDAVAWLETQITRAFIDTEDPFQALPFIIVNKTNSPILYKKALDTANLLEAYIDLFINTGVYVVFTDLVYERNEIIGINCEIRSNREARKYRIYEHDPTIQSVTIVDNTFSNYNKIIATEEGGSGQTFYFYLLDNNDITRDASDSRRIKQVRSKAISFSLASDEGEEDGLTEEEKQRSRAEALILTIYNELQAPEYDLKIEIEMLKNANLYLYRNIDFVSSKNIVYNSNITKVENLNDKQVRITLGALRNSLTDFKKKVEAI